jgi:hypothetical protein
MATAFDRKEKLIKDIMKTMHKRDTEDLKSIYRQNDVNRYSDEAFTAIERLLTERGERIPFRDTSRKREIRHAKRATVCGIGRLGLLISFTVWSPVLFFYIYNFGPGAVIYAGWEERAIAAGVFLVTGIIAEKLVCLIKD